MPWMFHKPTASRAPPPSSRGHHQVLPEGTVPVSAGTRSPLDGCPGRWLLLWNQMDQSHQCPREMNNTSSGKRTLSSP